MTWFENGKQLNISKRTWDASNKQRNLSYSTAIALGAIDETLQKHTTVDAQFFKAI